MQSEHNVVTCSNTVSYVEYEQWRSLQQCATNKKGGGRWEPTCAEHNEDNSIIKPWRRGTDGAGLLHIVLVAVLHLPHVLVLLLQTLLQLINLFGHWEREEEDTQ